MDAIVRPQLTITQSPPRQLPKEQCCLYATGKVLEKFRGWGSGPPLFYRVAVLPPHSSPAEKVQGIQWQGDMCGVTATFTSWAEGYRIDGAGQRSFKPVQNGTVKRKTQRKALQILGLWSAAGLCNKRIKLQIVGVCLCCCCVVCVCCQLNPAFK